jgi:hypothetical protein
VATAMTPAQSTMRTRFDGACNSDFPTCVPFVGGFVSAPLHVTSRED